MIRKVIIVVLSLLAVGSAAAAVTDWVPPFSWTLCPRSVHVHTIMIVVSHRTAGVQVVYPARAGTMARASESRNMLGYNYYWAEHTDWVHSSCGSVSNTTTMCFKLPIGLVSAILALVPFTLLVRFSFTRRWRKLGCCPKCEYDLTGNISGVCPECGKPIPAEQRAHLEKTTSHSS